MSYEGQQRIVEFERGVFILIFLLFVVGGSLTLFALRAPVVKSHVSFKLWSRETLLLGNTLTLIVGVGIGVTLLGVSLAWLTSLCEFPGRRWRPVRF